MTTKFKCYLVPVPHRLKLLLDIAKREKCTKLLTGDNCTKLAAQILSDMAQGRGAHVALECVCIIYSTSEHVYLLILCLI